MKIKKIIIYSLILHIVAAFFSSGFHKFDEHFQIIEFLNYKLGGIAGNELAWEFREHIRPWFQVFTYWVTIQPFKLLGVENPFFLAFFLRLISSLFGWYSTNQLWPLIDRWFKSDKNKIWAFALMHFCWFAPYILTRASAESFSISFFALGLSWLLTKQSSLWMILSGLAFGLAYQSRFHSALPVACVWIGLLVTKQLEVKKLVLCAVGVLIGFGSGFLFDYWGYGIWSFSLWHFYRTNFLEGIMAHVQHYPWYYYLRWSFLRGIVPVSLPLIIASLCFWIKKPKHVLTWATLPLFIFHSMVGHKELRYVFPVIIFSPLMLMMMIEAYQEKVDQMLTRKWVRGLTKTIISINIIVLFFVSFKPANVSVPFYQYVWGSKITKMYVRDEDPFSMLGLPIKFYRPKNLETIIFRDFSEIPIGVMASDRYIFVRSGEDMINLASDQNCELLYSTYPRWLLKFNYSNWISRSRVWSLFNCQM